MKGHFWVGFALLAFGVSSATAQTGVLDQHSPLEGATGGNAQFNVDADFLIWQQQIRVGIAGQLEGIRLAFAVGEPGSTVHVRVRLGNAWTEGPALADLVVTKAVSGAEMIFVDMTEAEISLNVDDTFVLETQGTNSGVWMIGSYVDPTVGEPLYPEPLFLGPGGFPPGWRHGFQTYMLTDEEPCPGDLDSDGVVGLSDLAVLLAHFGMTEGATFEDGDLNADGAVDLSDLAILLANFGVNCP